MQKLSVIVIGSNSVRILTADACDALSNSMRARAETRLFLHMTEDRAISAEAIEYLSLCIRQMYLQSICNGAKLIGVYATSAVRDASNSSLIDEKIQAICQMPLQILSGKEEASYSFIGAAGMQRAGIIDIGGGSTEIAIGSNGNIEHAVSMQLGASRLFQQHPINCEADIECAVNAARSIVLQHSALKSTYINRPFYLVGGTGTSSARIHTQCTAERGLIDGCILAPKIIYQHLRHIASTPRDERANIPGFPPSRTDILPTGMAILLAVMETLSLNSIQVTERGNTDGLLRAYVHKKFA